MGLTKNRITTLMQADSTPVSFTADSPSLSDSGSPTSYSEVYASAPNNAASIWTKTKFDKKNEWLT